MRNNRFAVKRADFSEMNQWGAENPNKMSGLFALLVSAEEYLRKGFMHKDWGMKNIGTSLLAGGAAGAALRAAYALRGKPVPTTPEKNQKDGQQEIQQQPAFDKEESASDMVNRLYKNQGKVGDYTAVVRATNGNPEEIDKAREALVANGATPAERNAFETTLKGEREYQKNKELETWKKRSGAINEALKNRGDETPFRDGLANAIYNGLPQGRYASAEDASGGTTYTDENGNIIQKNPDGTEIELVHVGTRDIPEEPKLIEHPLFMNSLIKGGGTTLKPLTPEHGPTIDRMRMLKEKQRAARIQKEVSALVNNAVPSGKAHDVGRKALTDLLYSTYNNK